MSVCPRCSLTEQEKQAHRNLQSKLPSCPYSQYLEFRDSIAFCGFPLSKMIDDVGKTGEKTSIERSDMFPSVYRYLSSLGLSRENQDLVSSAKITFPFEKISSISSLTSVTTPPPIGDFGSLLRAEEMIPSDQYNLFCKVWNVLNADTMLDMFSLYVSLDCLYLGDCLAFYFEEIYNTTELYPLYYKTISGLALDSALFHARDPVKKRSLLRLPLLSPKIYEKFKVRLIAWSLSR